jgi:hypothetical protein
MQYLEIIQTKNIITKMAFAKRFNKDILLLSHFKEFVNHLFDKEDKPCELLATETTKLKILTHFAGGEYESFDDFTRSTKNSQKRADRKEKVTEFLTEHKLELYPHSSYSIFLNEQKATYEKKFPDKSPKDLRDIMTKAWSEMSEDEKKKYNESFLTQKQEFINKVKAIDESYVVYFDKKQAPKKAPTPYILFVQEHMKLIKEENPTLQGKDVMRKVCEKWKAITDEEKQKYHDKCAIATSSDSQNPVTTKPKAPAKGESKATATKPAKEPKAKPTSTTNSSETTEVKSVATKKKADLKTLSKKLDNSDEEQEDSAQHEEVVVKKSAPKKKVSTKSDNDSEAEQEVKPKPAVKKPAKTDKKKKDAVDAILDNGDEE